MELVVTVDAEEDQWGLAASSSPTISNMLEIPALQRIFDDYHVVPTYLLTYPVAINEEAAAVFRCLLDAGRCEIGMHCHPWNTPPYEEAISRYNSMLCNLPPSLQQQKLHCLYELIQNRFQRPPLAFRSGRWGFGRETAGILAGLGCRIDSSITPYTSWTSSGGPDFSSYSPQTFAMSSSEFATNGLDGDLVEVPVTIGYVGGSFGQCHRIKDRLMQSPFRQLRMAGLLARMGLLRSVWLSPERETSTRLIRLLRQSMREGYDVVNLFFHSSSLQVGCTPFVRTHSEKQRLVDTLCHILRFCREVGIKNVPLSHAGRKILRNGSGGH